MLPTLMIIYKLQVVKNHLFSMSTSTLLSSVDSLPPTASVEGLPRVSEHTTEDSGSHLSPVVSMEDIGRAPEHTPDEPGTSQEPGVTKATDGKETVKTLCMFKKSTQ